MRSCTFTAATSARRLVEHWLDVRKLPMRHNGVKIDQQMSGTSVGEELSDYVSLSESIDGQTSIFCEDLVRLMQEEGMTVPPFLLPEVVESAAQKAFNEWFASNESNERFFDPVYLEAWALFEERDLWANMQHHNDPDKFEKIRANRARVEDALAKLSPRTEVQLRPGAEIAGKSVTKQQALIAFGGLVGERIDA